MKVTKKDGTLVPFNEVQILKKMADLSKGLNVDPKEVYDKTNIHYYDKMTTKELNLLAAETAHSTASIQNTDYDILGARLYADNLPTFEGALSSTNYAPCVLEFIHKHLSDIRDLYLNVPTSNRSYIGIKQIHNSYMVGDENIDLLFLSTAIVGLDGLRLEHIDTIKLALDLREGVVTLPSPMIKALRFHRFDIASCCTISMGDSIDSWTETMKAIVKHSVSNAGIGLNIAQLTSLGEKVRNGKVTHAGKVPIIKLVESLINSTKQEGRRGAASVFVSMLDPEIVDILQLKSPKTEIMKRVNSIKYGIVLRMDLLQELIKANLPLKLFSRRQEPELFDAQYYDNDFVNTYTSAYSGGKLDSYPEMSSVDLLSVFGTERFENGVYYPIYIDNVNKNSMFVDTIKQSNLCVEYLSPTKALDPNNTDSPDIGICVLSNVNQAKLDTLELLLPSLRRLVFMVNNIMRKQVHPTAQANAYIRDYATIGLGFSNHAYWVAKNGFKYGDKEILELHNQWMEWFSYSLVKSSMEYAKKYNTIPTLFWTKDTRGKYGVIEAMYSTPSADMLPLWKQLDVDVKEYGMANCSLSMVPPSESSSIGSNQTNNLLPVKDVTTVKDNGGIREVQYPPEITKLMGQYDYANYDKNITRKLIDHVAVTQRWIDMGISMDTFYNPELYEDKKVPLQQILSDLFYAYKQGVKTSYYNNVPVGQDENDDCPSGSCTV